MSAKKSVLDDPKIKAILQEGKELSTEEKELFCKDDKKTDRLGRKTVMTPLVVYYLKEAFLAGCSDREACQYAEIDKSTLYRFQKDNPDFCDQKEAWKENPNMIARKKVVMEIGKDGKLALDYLKHKKRDEFFTKVKQENVVPPEPTEEEIKENDKLLDEHGMA